MPGLVPGIYVSTVGIITKNVDGRDVRREDALRANAGHGGGKKQGSETTPWHQNISTC